MKRDYPSQTDNHFYLTSSEKKRKQEVSKSTRGMPRLSEAMKDAISCDKLGGGAHTR
jgi:hypothetical protein